jgi:glycosyltransferase involved in cell wall biosynthesis
MKRIAIVYPNFAHYREPIIDEIFKTLGSAYIINLVCDDKPDPHAIKCVSSEYLKQHNWVPLRNVYLPAGFTWQNGLLGHFWKNRYDSVIFLGQMNLLATWIAVPLLRMRGTKVLAWTHGVYGNEGRFKLFVRLTFYRLFPRIMLYGNHAKQIMLRYGFKPENLFVIGNSLDYKAQLLNRMNAEEERQTRKTVAKKLFPASQDLPIAVFIGRLTPVKRLDLFLKAAAKLKEEGIGINVLIIGSGSEESALKEAARTLGLEPCVCFYGECYEERIISELISISHVCVSPGNVGLTAMHALTYGTPVITHNRFEYQMPEFEAIEEGVTGSFFDFDNIDDLCHCIRNWIEKNEEERPRIRRTCMKVIDEFYNPAHEVSVIMEALRSTGLK